MDKGAFIVSRSLFESEIRFKPPEYLKIWIYLCGKANHKGKKYKGFYLERGQCFVDYNELLEQLEYKIGYRKKKYNDFVMKDIMKLLRSTLMITTTKQPRGVLVTILNYDKYQTLSNYETTNETTNETTYKPPMNHQTTPSINKNDKNNKEGKEINIEFDIFWDLYDKKIGDRNKCKKKWYSLKDGERDKILKTLPDRKYQFTDKQFQPYPETYLNQQRWNDEIKPRGRTDGFKLL